MPDEDSMKQFMDSNWTPGTPIPGSLRWREVMAFFFFSFSCYSCFSFFLS